jgi:nucleoside-diphosphate-sugar epimerase
MTRLLLLGATGFIGWHVLVEFGKVPDYELLCIDRSGSQVLPILCLKLDLSTCTPQDLAQVLTEFSPTLIVNCAGRTVGRMNELVAANISLVATLIEALVESHLSARLIHLSSAAEYGAVTQGLPISEDHPPHPTSAYAITKLAATQLLSQACDDYDMDIIILRVFNPIGAGLPLSTVVGRAASELHRAVINNADRITMGDLSAYRDVIDVRDVAKAVACAAKAPRQTQNIFNVGSGRAVQVREMVETLAQLAGFQGDIAEVTHGSPRSAKVTWQQADLSRIQDALAWQPTYDLATSLKWLLERRL